MAMDTPQDMLNEANRRKIEAQARNIDIKSQAREARKAASRADRIAKGYETGI